MALTGLIYNTSKENDREQWRRSLAEAGLTLVDGSFEEGATANNKTDAVWYIAGGQCYMWDSTFPRDVPAKSTPATTGGVGIGAWLSVGDATLRSELASENGFSLIGVGQTTLDKNIFWGTPEQYGAKGDGTTDDLAAVQECLNNHALTVLNAKVYACSGEVVVPAHHSIQGCGRDRSFLRRIGNTEQEYFVSLYAGTHGHEGSLYDFAIEGAGKVSFALYLGRRKADAGTTTVTKGHFSGLSVRDGKLGQVVLDAVQSSKFLNINFANSWEFESKHGVVLLNGAGNNFFDACEMSGGSEGSILMSKDANFPGYDINQYNQIPSDNTFVACTIESLNNDTVLQKRRRAIEMVYANYNRFFGCTITAHGTYSDQVVYLRGSASFNSFDRCNFSAYPSFPANTTKAMILNEGWCNSINGGVTYGLDGALNQVYSNNRMTVSNLIHQDTGLPAKVGGSNGLAMSKDTVRYLDTTDVAPTPAGFGEILTDKDSRYWFSRGNTPTDVVQIQTGLQKEFKGAATVANSVANAGIQLPDHGVYELDFTIRAGGDLSHRGSAKIRVVWHVGVQTVSATQISNALLATDTKIHDVAATCSATGYVTITTACSALTPAEFHVTLKRVGVMNW